MADFKYIPPISDEKRLATTVAAFNMLAATDNKMAIKILDHYIEHHYSPKEEQNDQGDRV